MVLDDALDQLLRFRVRQLVLRLALELRIANEHRQHRLRLGHHVVGGDMVPCSFLTADVKPVECVYSRYSRMAT